MSEHEPSTALAVIPPPAPSTRGGIAPGIHQTYIYGYAGPYRDYVVGHNPYWMRIHLGIGENLSHQAKTAGAQVFYRLNGSGVDAGMDWVSVQGTVVGWWVDVGKWSSHMNSLDIRSVQFRVRIIFNNGNEAPDSDYGNYVFVWATQMGQPFGNGFGIQEPTPRGTPYRQLVNVNIPVRPGLIPLSVQLRYRINNQPTVYTDHVGFLDTSAPPWNVDWVNRQFWFESWSAFLQNTDVTSVQFQMYIVYDETDVASQWSPEYWMAAPGNGVAIEHITWHKTGDPTDPFYMIYRVTTAMPYNQIEWQSSYNSSGAYPRAGTIAVPQRLGGVAEWPNGEAAFEWLTHNIWAETIRIRTKFNTTSWISSWSNTITSNTPLIWPYVLYGYARQQHVKEVIVGWTARNYGRPTKVGTFANPNDVTPLTTRPWMETEHPEWGDGIAELTAGLFTDGPQTITVSSAALVDGVEAWAWAPGLWGQIGITVRTQPTLMQLELVPSVDRQSRWVEMRFSCPCPTTSFEVERRLDIGAWEVIATINGDSIARAEDSFPANHVFTIQDQNVIIEDHLYWYRGRPFYRLNDTDRSDGTWSLEDDIEIDVSFNIVVNEVHASIKGYDDAILMGVYYTATAGEPIDLVTLWVNEDGADEYQSIWAGAPTAEAERWYVETPAQTFAKNSSWSFTFTDGVRRPIETDLYGSFSFNSSLIVDVDDYVPIGAPDDGA